jgi:hypothetical protein
MRRNLAVLALAGLLLSGVVACGGNPPQIVDYSPERGAKDVSTAAPIRITFDHDVDQASVESRLHLEPATTGVVRWLSRRQLSFEHPPLKPATTYQVVLEAGYSDLSGNTYVLRHHWAFGTEGPPTLSSSSPADTEAGVDPATYLSLDFSRDMDPTTLGGAITFVPAVPFAVRLDPSDSHRAIVAPDNLLEPTTTYTVTVSTAAHDADGNAIDRSQNIVFSTGAVRPLHHWIAFSVTGADGASGGLWIVDESGFPRHLFDAGSVRSFSWSPAGNSLLLQADDGSWSVFTPGQGAVLLGLRAPWAAALASGMGYAYVDDGGALHRLGEDGSNYVVAAGVDSAVVSPNGDRVAFVQWQNQTSSIWGYDVGISARYELGVENGLVTAMAWAPAGNRLAYLRRDAAGVTLRVRNLFGSADTTTIATGDLEAPTWMSDSTTLVFAAGVRAPNGVTRKAFLVSAIAPPPTLTLALGRPADAGILAASPEPSPDGHQIAFISDNQIWLMNADGTRPVSLTRFDSVSFPYSCRTVAWTRA